MSLINQMLKDLEHRSKFKKKSIDSLAGLTASAFSKWKYTNKNKKLILTVLLFIALFIGLIIKLYNIHQKSNIHQSVYYLKLPPIFQEKIPNNNDGMVLDLHATAAAVTSLTLQIQKEMTLLRILLSQDAIYRISKGTKGEYYIVLNHAKLFTNLPSINTMNSAINDIRMLNGKDGNLYLILIPKQGAELSRLELVKSGKYPELQIDFLYTEKNDLATIAIENTFAAENVSGGENLNTINPVLNTSLTARATAANDISIQNATAVSNTEIRHTVISNATNAENANAPINESLGTLTKSLVSFGPEDEYQQALQYSSQGNTNKAINILHHLLTQFPDYKLARESLVTLLLDQGKQVEANDIIQVGLQQYPSYSPYAQLKAKILVNEGKITDAINLLQRAAPTLQNNPEYHAFIAALYQRQGDSLLAAKLYEQLLPLEPDNAIWWMGLGIAYDNLGKHNDALQAFARADNDKLNPELKAYVESRMHSLQ